MNTLIPGIKPLIARRRKQRRAEPGLFIYVYAGIEQQLDGGRTIRDRHEQGAAANGITRVYVSAVRDQKSGRFYAPIRQRRVQRRHRNVHANPRRRPVSAQNEPTINVHALLEQEFRHRK